ncbi:MAG: ferrous iron transporter B, partial [Proteobacteria bacterium]|nr:ferrous iron transporter B [Pseudomonadota bacterium]
MSLFRKKSSCHTPHADTPCGARKVALVGNPNVGKSVLFNALTGAYVTVSNYPGTSVEVARGTAVIGGESFEIIDTPGMYSLLPITEEERVARKILLEDSTDMVIHVVDARNLERMLAMTMQLVEAGLPVILVVNIMDEAERLGIAIDIPLLSKRLGIPVIGTAVARKRGLSEIRESISCFKRSAHTVPDYSRRLENDIAEITGLFRSRFTLSPKAVALLLLQRDQEITDLVQEAEGEGFAAVEVKIREKIYARRESFHLDLSLERRKITEKLLDGVFCVPDKRKITLSEKLSRWAVRPLTGVPLLFIVLYFGLYQFVGVFGAGTMVDFLEKKVFEGYFNPWITGIVEDAIPWPVLQELFVGEYGVITLGLRYAVGIIMPIVATFFLFFSV